MTMDTCNDLLHFWETDSEICHCGKFKWDLDPLAWPVPVIQDEDEK